MNATEGQASEQPSGLHAGSREYRRANMALALAGFTCFALLYGTQPVLPQVAAEFQVSAGVASLTVAAGTAAMALLLIPLSLIADRYGRAPLMCAGLIGATLFSFASAVAPDIWWLLLARACVGVCIAGVPAAAMAYMGEEIAVDARGRAMGMYIGANALGGMSGRFLSALVAEWLDWRFGLAALALLGAGAAFFFWSLLPPSRNFVAGSLKPRLLVADLRLIYSDGALRWLFVLAFLIMGAFVGSYNYLGFRLSLPPYGFGPAAVGAVFLLYAIGSVSSAWAGHVGMGAGRSRFLLWMSACMAVGVTVTLVETLALVILGLAVFTFGYFAIHAVASAWVGQRAGARRGLVSALYLSSYYLGGSVIGSATGWPWAYAGWAGVVATILACTLAVAAILVHLRRRVGA